MLINPTYGAGGAQSSGYVEDAAAIHENKSWETADLYQSIAGNLGLPALSPSQGFTFEARIAPTALTPDYSAFLNLEASGNYRIQMGLTKSQKDASSDYGFVVWGAGREIIYKPSDINFSEWHTFTYTADTSSGKLYIDGTFIETQSPALSYTMSPISIYQMYYQLVSRQTRGKWGCTRWYNRVLTADEIAANYAIDAEKYDET